MAIQGIQQGVVSFDISGKIIDKKRGESPIYQRYWSEVPLTICFKDQSGLVFRYELDNQRFTHGPMFFEGSDGTKEAFLQPAEDELREDLEDQGYRVLRGGADPSDDFYKRVRLSFAGLGLEQCLLLQHPELKSDHIILKNQNGELRFSYDHGFLIAVEETTPAGEKTVYAVSGKNIGYRRVDLMVASELDRRTRRAGPFAQACNALSSSEAIRKLGFGGVTEKDLFSYAANSGKVVELGAFIR